MTIQEIIEQHRDHEWREVPPCVYCVPCDVRLFQGSIPAEKDPALAAKRAACKHYEHVMYDDGDGNLREQGEGFYWVCAECGFRDWYE